jgi:hypothetical protein
MNRRFSALSIASLAGLMLSGSVLASPNFMGRDFLEFSVRNERTDREFGKREEREAQNANRQQDKKGERKAEELERERGYGYGYERRNQQPSHDGRGRR